MAVAVEGVTHDARHARTSRIGVRGGELVRLGAVQARAVLEHGGADVSALWGTRALRAYRQRVQAIFQDPYETLNRKQTVHDFVAEPLEVNGLAPRLADREAQVRAALESAGLPADFAFRYPHELSGGQRQRVVIAGALVMGPELMVADEPVSMLEIGRASCRERVCNGV